MKEYAMGLSYDDLFPGRFLKATIFKGHDVTLTIGGVRVEDLPSETGGTKVKGILSFEGKKLELVLNRTNGEAMKAMWGRDVESWKGKRVTLYPSTFNGEPCIRVRGSPDLPDSMEFELKLPRKRPQRVKLLKTTPGKQSARQPEDDPEPEIGDAAEVLS
jgi:hypothetical protein